ncbi:MAG: IS21 family transposase [Ignavibacteriae bacterium]|nr:IS21 family transposase [Ignavibacteriota bacterium]
MYTTIKTLKDKGLNKSEVVKATGHDWKTVSKTFKAIENGEEQPKRKAHVKILDSKKEEIIKWLEEGLTGVLIHERLNNNGTKVSYSNVKLFCKDIKRKNNIFIRIHTKPGEEAQVDFGYVGLTKDNNGKKRKTWVFNMRLSYSRKDYFEKVYDQKVETFIGCHINAFEYFGGVPSCVRIDNLKAAILEANFYEPIYQHQYKSFTEYYGFNSIPCRIYHPNDKGKVESGIKYVKNNFYNGRTFKDEHDQDRQLKNWQDNKCNKRIHGTTRKVPDEVFYNEEKQYLLYLPFQRYKISEVGTRKVYHDCHIFVDYNYYSAPFKCVGKEVEIEKTKELVKIFHNNEEIATHIRIKGRGEFSTQEHHYPKYKRYSDTEYQELYQAKMSVIGPYAEQIFLYILETSPYCWTRPVQGILSLKKNFPNEIINLSCKRALAYGVNKYSIIKNICSNGSYALPLNFNYKGHYFEYNQN